MKYTTLQLELRNHQKIINNYFDKQYSKLDKLFLSYDKKLKGSLTSKTRSSIYKKMKKLQKEYDRLGKIDCSGDIY